MAKHHGRLDDEVADGAVHPIVHIAAADAGVFDVDEDVVGRLQGRDGSAFEFDAAGAFEDKGEVLLGNKFVSDRSTMAIAIDVSRFRDFAPSSTLMVRTRFKVSMKSQFQNSHSLDGRTSSLPILNCNNLSI
jgi:hypothetical protein